MTQVTLTLAAVGRLVADTKIGAWKKQRSAETVPILGYYRRSYFTSDDGEITEFGNGFLLTFDRADMDWKAQGLTAEAVAISDDCNILVVAPHSLFLKSYKIDWNGEKYTYNPSINAPILNRSAVYN